MRRRTISLCTLTAAALLAVVPAAVAAPAAKVPAAKTFTGTETPNFSYSTGSKRTISFKLSGNTVSKLTIGAGTAACTPYDTAGNPGTPFTVKTKQLTLPTITLNHGTYLSSQGLTIDGEFVRPGGSGGFKLSPSIVFDEAGYTVDLDIISNLKRTQFGSKIDGDQLAGLAVDFHMNAAGQINRNFPDNCTFGGNVSLKVKK
jgi:hypothetical protein